MRNNLIFTNQNKPPVSDEALKATALIYLKDALAKQEFEQCPDIIQSALNFGADKAEVAKVIADFIKGTNAAPYAFKRKGAGRF
jgi:hypothetical protein